MHRIIDRHLFARPVLVTVDQQSKTSITFGGCIFVASRDGSVVSVTRDGQSAGSWRWDDEGGLTPVGSYVNLMPDTDDSEDVIAELSARLRAMELPS